MSENSKIQLPPSAPQASSVDDVARRRLMRAGLSAAPVVLALKSQSVLAGGDVCIKPSAFSSLKAANMKLSRIPNQGWTCYSHGYWKNHTHPDPYQTLDKSFFLLPARTSPQISAGFSWNPGGWYTNKTLIEILNEGGSANSVNLARHVVGTFLTAVSLADDTTKVLLTTSQCRQIWDSQGTWSPVAGATWTFADWMAYFDYIYRPMTADILCAARAAQWDCRRRAQLSLRQWPDASVVHDEASGHLHCLTVAGRSGARVVVAGAVLDLF